MQSDPFRNAFYFPFLCNVVCTKECVEPTTAGWAKPQVLADSGLSTVCRITRYQRGHSFVPSCSQSDPECSVCVFMFRSTGTTGVKDRPPSLFAACQQGRDSPLNATIPTYIARKKNWFSLLCHWHQSFSCVKANFRLRWAASVSTTLLGILTGLATRMGNYP